MKRCDALRLAPVLLLAAVGSGIFLFENESAPPMQAPASLIAAPVAPAEGEPRRAPTAVSTEPATIRASAPASRPGAGAFRPLAAPLLTAVPTPTPSATPGAASSPTTTSPATARAGVGSSPVSAQTRLADLLSSGADLADPAQRALVVSQLRTADTLRKSDAAAKAARAGLPTRVQRPDGSVIELVRFEGDQPVYVQTHNVNASLSTHATALRSSPDGLDGSGVTVGVWDGGGVRTTHQELGSRVTIKDGGDLLDHSTHVAGTIAGVGTDAKAKGMAPAAKIDSYEWDSDKTEMIARGAAYPGESGTIYLSNHSYGYVGGWTYTGYTTPKWNWYGSGTTSSGAEDDFGKYDTNARDTDSLAVSLPYYLMFRSAGNDRADNPATGDSVSLSTSVSSASAVSYNPASHPGGDGSYKSGYDSLAFDAVAKNIVTVGAVSDAVANGARDVSKARTLSFSSWGPTDDGRIKPDLVANGESLYSALSDADASYGTMSGTSMSSPNATGTAALLVQLYGRLFPGQAMRASTLKALLIATADDLGTAGPDYQYGWGLINAEAAADLLKAYRTSPGTRRIVEDRVTTTTTTRSYPFVWDGTSPIRATLCWTDPAATATASGELHTARLVNNLDLKLTGPGGTTHQPHVMPYVGTWTTAALSAAATTGKNNTDTVEQVYLATPPAAGTYTAVVTFDGTLTTSAQTFSLIIDGGVTTASAPAPVANAVTPAAGSGGTSTITLSGSGFMVGATLALKKTGESEVAAFGQEVVSDSARFRVKLAGVAAGVWDIVLTNPDGQSTTLAGAFTVSGSLWTVDFEDDVSPWTQGASVGLASGWALSESASHSTSHAVFASAPPSRGVGDLYSPAVTIPANASALRLSFWHYYGFQSGRDGGVLEFSLDDGTTWFDVTAADSGAAFATGGYNTTLVATGPTNSRNPLAGRSAWSGSTSGFTQVAIDLTHTAKYAGQTLKVRWRLGTDQSFGFGPGFGGGGGWYVDDIELAGSTGPVNLAPSIVSAAAATPETVTASSATLTADATDDGGSDKLTYTWAATGEYYKLVQFSDNGRNTAKTTTATFAKAGTYTITVTVRDAQNLAATSVVDVTVEQTASGVTVSPGKVLVGRGSTQQFTGTQVDQFGDAMETQPTLTWAVSGGGTISASGLLTASATDGGPFTVTVADPSAHTANGVFTVWHAATALAGRYSALLSSSDGVGGRLTLTANANGTVSGTITTSDGTASFRGVVDAAGRLTATVDSVRVGKIELDLTGSRDGGIARFEGTVTIDGVTLTLDRSSELATVAEAGLAAGQFTFVLLPDATQTEAPQGYGWATATLARSGALRLTGSLADGTAISLTSALHRDGELPIFLPTANGLVGTLRASASATPPIAGALRWEKEADAASEGDAAGFSTALAARGYRYVAPAGGDTILDYGAPAAADLWFSLGGLSAAVDVGITFASPEKRFTFTLTDLATLRPAAFVRGSGIFRGKFSTLAEPAVLRSYFGVLLQGANEGYGFFLGASASGRVHFIPD